MILKTKRLFYKQSYIVGKLYIDNQFYCDTLELPDLHNLPNVSCIPKGIYRVKMLWSEHFQRNLPHIVDVVDRTEIMIHSANYPNEIKGCIAIGKNDIVGGVSNSLFYSNGLNTLLEQQTNDIVIIIE